jgi:hypothetical protein
MWDPTEFYDNLEHSIFKIMLTCGTKLVYDAIAKLIASQNKHGIGNARL